MPLVEEGCRYSRVLIARVDINRFRLCIIADLGSLVVSKIAFVTIVAEGSMYCVVGLRNLRCNQHVPRQVHISGLGSAKYSRDLWQSLWPPVALYSNTDPACVARIPTATPSMSKIMFSSKQPSSWAHAFPALADT